jgi:hypothetical protein
VPTLLKNLGKVGKPEPPGHTKGKKTVINLYDTLPKIARGKENSSAT